MSEPLSGGGHPRQTAAAPAGAPGAREPAPGADDDERPSAQRTDASVEAEDEERGERRGRHRRRRLRSRRSRASGLADRTTAADRAAAIERAVALALEARRTRVRRVALGFALLVGGPTLLAGVHYGAIATPEYESVAVVTIDQGEPPSERPSQSAKGGPLDPALQAVRAHLLARSQIAKLARANDLAGHYQDRRIDWLSRLDDGARSEEAFGYYLGKLSVVGDTSGGTLTGGARAFSARRAREIARLLVADAEGFVERMSERARRDLESSAAAGLEGARERMARARALPPSDLELELARDQMLSALRAAEMARVDAARRHRHLVVVAEPSLPDEPSYPRRVWNVATVFFGALVLVVVLWLLVAVVREHAEL